MYIIGKFVCKVRHFLSNFANIINNFSLHLLFPPFSSYSSIPLLSCARYLRILQSNSMQILHLPWPSFEPLTFVLTSLCERPHWDQNINLKQIVRIAQFLVPPVLQVYFDKVQVIHSLRFQIVLKNVEHQIWLATPAHSGNHLNHSVVLTVNQFLQV